MKSIRIYQEFNGEKKLLALWSNLPDSILIWFAQNFNNPNMDSNYRPFNLNNERFIDLLDFCYNIKQIDMDHSSYIAKFLSISEDDASAIHNRIFIHFYNDAMAICKRKLDNNLFWRFKEDCHREPEKRTGLFRGRIHSIRKESTDSGRGCAKRYMHDAQYFVYAYIDFYGFPVGADSRLSIDIRPAFCEQNNKQHISEELLEKIKEKNIKRHIKTILKYKYNDEWPWDITIVDKNDVIKQLDLKI